MSSRSPFPTNVTSQGWRRINFFNHVRLACLRCFDRLWELIRQIGRLDDGGCGAKALTPAKHGRVRAINTTVAARNDVVLFRACAVANRRLQPEFIETLMLHYRTIPHHF